MEEDGSDAAVATAIGVGDGSASQQPRALRPREAVAREEELRRVHRAAAERTSWAPQSSDDREAWDGRHHLVYLNDGLSQGFRSYFDRVLHHRPPGSKALGALTPFWRLSASPPAESERTSAKKVRRWFSCGPRVEATTAPPRPAPGARRAARLNRERPFALPPPESAAPPSPARRPGPGGGAAGGAWGDLGTRSLDTEQPSSSMASFSADPAMFAMAAKAEMEGGPSGWDSSHHVVWSNERSVGGKVLNPVQTRSYFDRMRIPAPAERSVQTYHPKRRAKQEAEEEEVEKGERPPVGPVTRVLPTWRLEPLPGHALPSAPEMPLPRPSALASHSGPGGGNRRAQVLRFSEDGASSPVEHAQQGRTRVSPAAGSSSSTSTAKASSPAPRAPACEAAVGIMRQSLQSEASTTGSPISPPRGSSPGGILAPTFASACRRRERLAEGGKLPVQWRLADGNPGDTRKVLLDSLRRCGSDPGTREGRWQERRREAWFSSHAVAF